MYIFESLENGGHWTQTARLFASDYDTIISDFYGSTYGGVVEVYANTIVVSDEEDNFISPSEKKIYKNSGTRPLHSTNKGDVQYTDGKFTWLVCQVLCISTRRLEGRGPSSSTFFLLICKKTSTSVPVSQWTHKMEGYLPLELIRIVSEVLCFHLNVF